MRYLKTIFLVLSLASSFTYANSAEKTIESKAFDLENMMDMLANFSPANKDRHLYAKNENFKNADLCVYLMLREKLSKTDIPTLEFVMNKYKDNDDSAKSSLSKLLIANFQGHQIVTKLNTSQELRTRCDLSKNSGNPATAKIIRYDNRRSLAELFYASMMNNQSKPLTPAEEKAYARASGFMFKQRDVFEAIGKRLSMINKFPGAEQEKQIQSLADELAPKIAPLNEGQIDKISPKEYVEFVLTLTSIAENAGH